MKKPKKANPTAQRTANSVAIPYQDPETCLSRLETIYGACSENDLIYVDLKDSETGEIMHALCGVDDSEENVKLIPLAKWLTADDVLGKSYEVWNGEAGGWVGIKETKLSKEAWDNLKFGE